MSYILFLVLVTKTEWIAGPVDLFNTPAQCEAGLLKIEEVIKDMKMDNYDTEYKAFCIKWNSGETTPA